MQAERQDNTRPTYAKGTPQPEPSNSNPTAALYISCEPSEKRRRGPGPSDIVRRETPIRRFQPNKRKYPAGEMQIGPRLT